ncbi:MAG: hypothetical protein ACR2FH_08645, partial [Caulobacteraceae bacterium]
LVLVLTLLGGCNVVVTRTPLFSAADEAGAPALRPGVWRAAVDPACAVDEATPLGDWPPCAGGVALRPGEGAYHNRDTAKGVLTHEPFVFAGGEPRIGQARVVLSGDIKLEGDATPYIYAGARATKLDDRGRIVAVLLWPVQCGPPRIGATDGDTTTLHPLPGIQMKANDPVCAAPSAAVLRAAARASEAWAEKPLNAHWVRDGDS